MAGEVFVVAVEFEEAGAGHRVEVVADFVIPAAVFEPAAEAVEETPVAETAEEATDNE